MFTKRRIAIHSAAAVRTEFFVSKQKRHFFTILNLYFVFQIKTYGSNFFDDKIDCQCQQ